VDSSPTGSGTAAGALPARLRMEPAERRSLGGLAAIYAARMLGLFLLLPVLALYAGGLPGATPLLVGLAMGAYGLTQACLQIPFGALSDRVGRRPMILVGLVLYALGSVLGALASGIWGVVVGRMVQGAGAVSGPVTALLADQTRVQVRTRAMALIGISIGASFVVSLLAAPVLEPLIGVPGIFWAMAGLAGLCIVLLYAVVPPPPRLPMHPAGRPPLTEALTATLVPYYIGIFALNFVLTATFFGVPHVLRDVLHVDVHDHWKTYLTVFSASILPTIPLVLVTERSARPDEVVRFGIALLMISLGWLAFVYSGRWSLDAALIAFFAAFNYLEARLPAGLSQAAAPGIRGAALGIFATAQFLGAFAGGVAAGALYGSRMGLVGVFGGASLVALAWLLLARPARR
jgi:MFS family permease